MDAAVSALIRNTSLSSAILLSDEVAKESLMHASQRLMLLREAVFNIRQGYDDVDKIMIQRANQYLRDLLRTDAFLVKSRPYLLDDTVDIWEEMRTHWSAVTQELSHFLH